MADVSQLSLNGTVYPIKDSTGRTLIAENANNIAVQTARIDEFSSLPPGSTSGNAELLDIRVKANGATDTTAGDAVRNQVHELKSDVELAGKYVTRGLTAAVSGILLSSGVIQSNTAGWSYVTAFVHHAKSLMVSGNFQHFNTTYNHIGFYSGKNPQADNFISGINISTTTPTTLYKKVYKVPDNAQTMVFCTTNAKINSILIATEDNYVFDRIEDTISSGYILDSNGRAQTYSGANVSNYFSVKDATKVMFDTNRWYVSDQYASLCFYDDYGNLISSYNGKKTSYDVPSDAVFARYSANTTPDGHYLLNNKSGTDNSNKDKYKNLLLNYPDFEYTVSGLNFVKTGGRISIAGVPDSVTSANIKIFPLDHFLPGKSYRISFSSVENVYLQSRINTTITTLSSGSILTIPDDCVDFYIRLLINVTSGTTVDKAIDIEFREWTEDDVDEVHVSTAAELYNFFVNFVSSAKHIKLFIDPGTYDLYDDLYENYILNDSTTMGNNYHYLHNVEIVGNNATLVLKVPEAVESAHKESVKTVSILNVKGNVTVRDLVLDAENCRYACHDETIADTSVWNTDHIFENVVFKFNRTSANVTAGVFAGIGIGGNYGQKYVFKNCQFIRTGYGGSGGAFYIHGRGYNIAEINFYNCLLTSTGPNVMHFSQYTGNDQPTAVHINNCLVNGLIDVYPQTETGTNCQQWVFTIVNSYYTKLRIKQTNVFPLISEPTIINTISGTISHNYDTQ